MLKSINNLFYPSIDDTEAYENIYIINNQYVFLADSTKGLLNQIESNDLNIEISTQETLENTKRINYIELESYIAENFA